MRVLLVTNRDIFAPQTGADRRARGLSDALRRQVTLTTASFSRRKLQRSERPPGGAIVVERPALPVMRLLAPRILAAVFRTVWRNRPDVIVASCIEAFAFGFLTSVLARSPLVLDDHNVEYELVSKTRPLRRALARWVERVACRLSDVVVAVSERDRQILARWAPRTIVVPNGFDPNSFSAKVSTVRDPGRVLFFGNLDYHPNREAVDYIEAVLAPMLRERAPQVTLRIAGRADKPLSTRNGSNTEYVGFVDDIATEIATAALVICPLRQGSGTRLKIIESLACETPVLSTPKGAEGLPVDRLQGLTIATLDEFPDAAVRLLENGHTTSDGFAASVSELAWESVIAPLVDYLKEE